MSGGIYSDLRLNLDTLEGDPGAYYLFNSEKPETRYEVTDLLDGDGEHVDDVECAAGGVVKISENQFMVFTL